jgi:hypothetical protein
MHRKILNNESVHKTVQIILEYTRYCLVCIKYCYSSIFYDYILSPNDWSVRPVSCCVNTVDPNVILSFYFIIVLTDA